MRPVADIRKGHINRGGFKFGMVLGSYFVRDKYGLGHIWRGGGSLQTGFYGNATKIKFSYE